MNDREMVILNRIKRCAEANTAEGERMRHCESCEVPVGTMTVDAFFDVGTCETCGKPVHVACLNGYDE